MLRIRPQQVQALGEKRYLDFLKRLKEHLAEVFSDRLVEAEDPTVQVDEWASAGVSESTKYGIRRERDVMLFADLQVGIGADFPGGKKLTWCRKILESEDLDGTAKIEFIYKQLPARNPEYLTE